MSESNQLELAVQELITDLCEVLYTHGYQEISVGVLMRVIGVSEEQCHKHDREVIDLLSHFAKQSAKPKNTHIPPGTTLH